MIRFPGIRRHAALLLPQHGDPERGEEPLGPLPDQPHRRGEHQQRDPRRHPQEGGRQRRLRTQLCPQLALLLQQRGLQEKLDFQVR